MPPATNRMCSRERHCRHTEYWSCSFRCCDGEQLMGLSNNGCWNGTTTEEVPSFIHSIQRGRTPLSRPPSQSPASPHIWRALPWAKATMRPGLAVVVVGDKKHWRDRVPTSSSKISPIPPPGSDPASPISLIALLHTSSRYPPPHHHLLHFTRFTFAHLSFFSLAHQTTAHSTSRYLTALSCCHSLAFHWPAQSNCTQLHSFQPSLPITDPVHSQRMKFRTRMAMLFQSSAGGQLSETKTRGASFKLFGKKKKPIETPAVVAPPTLPPLDIVPAKPQMPVVIEEETRKEATPPKKAARRNQSADIDYELRQHLKNEGISFLAFADFGEAPLQSDLKTSAPISVSKTTSAPSVVQAPKSMVSEAEAPTDRAKDEALENLRNFYLGDKKTVTPAPVTVTLPRRDTLPQSPLKEEVEPVVPQPMAKSAPPQPSPQVPELKKILIPKVENTSPTPPGPQKSAQPEGSASDVRKREEALKPLVSVNNASVVVKPSSGKLQKRKPTSQQPVQVTPLTEQSEQLEVHRKSPDSTISERDSGKFVNSDSSRETPKAPERGQLRPNPDHHLHPEGRQNCMARVHRSGEQETNGFLRPEMPTRRLSHRRAPSPSGHSRSSNPNGRPQDYARSKNGERDGVDGLIQPGMPPCPQSERRPPPPNSRPCPPALSPDGRQLNTDLYPAGPGPRKSPTYTGHGSPLNGHPSPGERPARRPFHLNVPHGGHRSRSQGPAHENRRRSKPAPASEKWDSTESSQSEDSDFAPRNERRRTVDLPVPVMLPPERSYTPAISEVHTNCADSHRFTVHCANVHHRIACMVCRTDSSSERFLCSYCALRFCGRCKAEFSKDMSIEQIRKKAVEEDWASQAPSNLSIVAPVNKAWEMACNLDGNRSHPRIRQPGSAKFRGPPPPRSGPRRPPPNRSDSYLPAMRGGNSSLLERPPHRNESFNNSSDSSVSQSRATSEYDGPESDREMRRRRHPMPVNGMHSGVRNMLAISGRSHNY
ncbi:hypothetical protein EX30DRAFT_233545 [Ascodesmis nigricans]|uniref:Uncharacterized protein n=1 Tax=Ascodesmis nigricans TaxID=341454 RepID=A0A4S2MYQ0_9PEZI|nr:hypothetical protein EX30DRAFT_233545 [Ascodesmis nigricans]